MNIMHKVADTAQFIADNPGWSFVGILIIIFAVSMTMSYGIEAKQRRWTAERDSNLDTGSPDSWRNYM